MRIAKTKIMGIINATPDSFSDGGAHLSPEIAISRGLQLVEHGADILDIGGESTRPGAEFVPSENELARVLPVIEGLREAGCSVPISIDTRKPEVADRAFAVGATIWNDVSALGYAPESLSLAARLTGDIVLMHSKGDPKTMQDRPSYEDVVEEVRDYLRARIAECVKCGISRDRLIVDPGIGFGKTLEHNLALLANLSAFNELTGRVLLGASRKRFIAAIDRDGSAKDRIGGSIAAALAGVAAGVEIIRVHDVEATRQAIRVHEAIIQG